MGDGKIHIIDAITNQSIAPVTPEDINPVRQVGIAEKREVLQQSKKSAPSFILPIGKDGKPIKF